MVLSPERRLAGYYAATRSGSCSIAGLIANPPIVWLASSTLRVASWPQPSCHADKLESAGAAHIRARPGKLDRNLIICSLRRIDEHGNLQKLAEKSG
jgi:hypothetical protein